MNLYLEFCSNDEYFGHAIPKHPEKNFAQKILGGLGTMTDNTKFLESRKRSLGFFVRKLLCHWRLRDSDIFRSFLGEAENTSQSESQNLLKEDQCFTDDIKSKGTQMATYMKKFTFTNYEYAKNMIKNKIEPNHGQHFQNYFGSSLHLAEDEKFFSEIDELLKSLLDSLAVQYEYHVLQYRCYNDIIEANLKLFGDEDVDELNENRTTKFHENQSQIIDTQLFF